MTKLGTSYKTILNRLMLQGCQLCDVAHDFRYDPRICHIPEEFLCLGWGCWWFSCGWWNSEQGTSWILFNGPLV